MTLTDVIPKKGSLLKPVLPLVDTTPIDVDKTSMVVFTLKVRPGGSNKHTYKKIIRRFCEGSPPSGLKPGRILLRSGNRTP